MAELGKYITRHEFRDAVHVAVAPVVAGEELLPGEHVGFIGDNVVSSKAAKKFGVVDPFLTESTPKGYHIWVLLYPNTVTSLRHEWTHRDFTDSETTGNAKVARARLEHFADEVGLRYDQLIDATINFVEYDEYLCDGGRYEGQGLYDGFWLDYEIVTGNKVRADKQWSFFTCSC